MMKRYDPKCNLQPGQMVHLFGSLGKKGRPFIVLALLYGGRFVAAPVSTVIRAEGFKFLNEKNLANSPIHKFEIFSFEDVEDYKFSFKPHHEDEVEEMINIWEAIISGRFNPSEIPLWFETREEVILDKLFEKEKKKYIQNFKARFPQYEFGTRKEKEPIKSEPINVLERKHYPSSNGVYPEGIAHIETPVSTSTKKIITIDEFCKKCLQVKHADSISLETMYTLYSRLASYFRFDPPEIGKFKELIENQLKTDSRFQKVRFKDNTRIVLYKNLNLKYPANTDFKKLGLETTVVE